MPRVAAQIGDLRRRPRRHLGGQAERVGFLEDPVAVPDLVLVECSLAQPRHKKLPETAGNVLPHGMPAAVPVVEIAHDADARRVRRPDGEIHPVNAVDLPQLGPQPVVTLPVAALVQQVEVVVGQQVREGVRVVHSHGLFSVFLGHSQHVARRAVAVRQGANRLVQAGRVDAAHRLGPVRVGRIYHPRLARRGQIGPDGQGPASRMVNLVGPQ